MPEPKRPVRRVRRAFDQDALKRICEMHETEFPSAYGMDVTVTPEGWKVADYPLFYAFLDRGSDILAVAHLDTCVSHKQRKTSFVDTADGPVVHSGALDDRLGAYTILELLPKLGINVDVLLTTGEESGMSTAEHFTPPPGKEYRWMIEFDRGGTDVVMYQYEDNECKWLVKDSGARFGSGSFSDIAYLEHLEIKGFNWGVGYEDYHSVRGYAYLQDYWMMLGHFVKFHAANVDKYLPHEPAPMGRYGSYSGGVYGGRWWDIEDCKGCGLANYTNPNGDLCETCEDEYAELYANQEADDLVSDDFNIVNERLLAIHQDEYLPDLWKQ